jgi:hypothetical protein
VKRTALLWLWLAVAPLAHATLTAEVDSTTISAADTVRLTVRVDTTNPTGMPNLDALSADFAVLSTQTSSQFRSMNGHVDAWTIWTFLLKPKHGGTLQIPALSVGGEQSKPISIAVRELDPQLRHAIGETVFFETTHTPDRVYVQSQVVVTRKLFYANGAQLYGEMPEIPEIPGALVRPLGDAEQSTAMRDGRQYGLIEQRFAVFPEHSGKLEIPIATVSGSVRLPADAGMGGRRIGIDVSSEPLTINVLPIPAEYPDGAPWLPATQVELLEDWPGEPARGLAVGTPSQRTLIVRVDGNTASAIPPLAASIPATLKSYPEAPHLNEVPTAAGIVGTRTETTSLVATQPGATTLAEVSLTWWDTVNQQVKTASVPAHTLDVTGTATPQTTQHPDETIAAPAEQPAMQAPAASVVVQPNTQAPGFATWYAVGAILLLALCIVGWRLQRQPRAPRTVAPTKAEAAAYRTLARACASEDLKQIRTALDGWLTAHFALPISAATALFTRDPNARAAVNALNARLYQHDHGERFDAPDLRACVDALRSRHTRERRPEELPALYPSV